MVWRGANSAVSIVLTKGRQAREDRRRLGGQHQGDGGQGDAEEEEPYGYEWGGDDEADEQEQPENNESMVKTILIEMKKYVEEELKEQKEKLSLSSLAIEDEVVCIKRSNVLLD